MNNLELKNIHIWPLIPRMVFLGCLFLATIYFGYFFNISNLQNNLATAKRKEVDLKQQLEMAIRNNARLTTELSNFSSLQGSLKEWRNRLITQPELSELLNEILKIGSNNQLYFSLFNPGDEVKDGDFKKIPIKMIVVGSYVQLIQFISQVANMPKVVAIGDFIVSNENKNDVLGAKMAEIATAKNFLTAEVSLDVFLRVEAKKNEP